jgi:Phytanoyl-CoA dioxygenase (PhyH)
MCSAATSPEQDTCKSAGRFPSQSNGIRSVNSADDNKSQTLDQGPADLRRAIYEDGIAVCKGAFSVGFADEMREDIEALFLEARSIPGSALSRGPNRWYVEIHPERLRGFIAIIDHAWFKAMCEAVLGKDWRIVEVGFDIPFPGAQDQPWHRDFTPPQATFDEQRLNSLAFNLTAVDVLPSMGPLLFAPGTQWENIPQCPHNMFPPEQDWPGYDQIAEIKAPRRGDMTARTALAIHRGTANVSSQPRPMLVIGVDGPDATNGRHHDLQVSKAFADTLPPHILRRIDARVVDALEPIIQKHVIDGLM